MRRCSSDSLKSASDSSAAGFCLENLKRFGFSPSVESFYHLPAAEIPAGRCRGFACFLARHRDPQGWKNATSHDPRIYCLGKCYAAPATTASEERPTMRVLARRAVVLERLVRGGARTLSQYKSQGGYRAIEAALK